ncbi:MAG TPA: polysaccharide biosynthesis tyrosine autokinase [Longimicrobium sp.]
MNERLALPGSTTPIAPAAAPGVVPRTVWGALRRHRWLILACLLAGLGTGYVLVRRIEPSYRAQTLLQVSAPRPGLQATAPGAAAVEGDNIATEILEMQSRPLAEAVVDSLRLQVTVAKPGGARRSSLLAAMEVGRDVQPARYRFERRNDLSFDVTDAESGASVGTFAPGAEVRIPEGRLVLARTASRTPEFEIAIDSRQGAAASLESSIDVGQPDRTASVVNIRYEGSDPELVRDVPNVLAATFIASRRELHSTDARTTANFLRGQLGTIKGQLTEAENKLQAFREANQVVDLPVEASTQVARQAQMQADRGMLQSESASLGALINQARNTTRRPGEPSPFRQLVGFPSLLRNEAASEMLRQLTAVESQRAELLTRRKEHDPDVVALTQRAQSLESQLASLVTTYQRGLSSQVSSIDNTLGSFSRRMDQIPGKQLEFARLSRQTRVLEETYGLLQTRLKEAEITQAVQDPRVRVVEAAELPMKPVGSQKGLLLGLTGIAGLLLGVGAGMVREYRDGTVHSRDDVQAATGYPVLGWVPRIAELKDAEKRPGALSSARRMLTPGGGGTALVAAGSLPLLPGTAAGPSPAADAYEWLHRNLQFAEPDAEVKTLVVSSPLPGDGKSTSAAGLAVTLARRGLKVLLIDADLRRGTLSTRIGPRKRGLSDLLAGNASFQQVLRTVDVGNGNALHYIPTGVLPADCTRLLGSARAQALMEWLRQKYYLVILDTPPINVFADTAVLGGYADAVMLVARAGVTPFDALVECAEQCRRARLPVLGTLLNDIDPDRDREYDAAYKWQSYAQSYYTASQV